MNLPNPVAIATPVFVLLVLVEMLAARFGRGAGRRARFEAGDSLTSLTMGLGSSIDGQPRHVGAHGAAVFRLEHDWIEHCHSTPASRRSWQSGRKAKSKDTRFIWE